MRSGTLPQYYCTINGLGKSRRLSPLSLRNIMIILTEHGSGSETNILDSQYGSLFESSQKHFPVSSTLILILWYRLQNQENIVKLFHLRIRMDKKMKWSAFQRVKADIRNLFAAINQKFENTSIQAHYVLPHFWLPQRKRRDFKRTARGRLNKDSVYCDQCSTVGDVFFQVAFINKSSSRNKSEAIFAKKK